MQKSNSKLPYRLIGKMLTEGEDLASRPCWFTGIPGLDPVYLPAPSSRSQRIQLRLSMELV